MTYSESIDFLYGLRLFGLKMGLENTRKLAALAGNPQDRLRFIHIAGTNGKGSVAAMLDSIYRASGLRVGLYTSPHLVSFRERIQVNRQMISEADVVRLVAGLKERSGAGTPIPGEPRPEARATFFEFVTVIALEYFLEQQCDLVIWETGLGGRLDATNIVTPLISVITNIEFDHQEWLGHDLRSIAREKAGIIKQGVPVITAAGEPDALAVIQETALAQNSPLTWVTPAHTNLPPLDTIRLGLSGWHQRMNATTALATVGVLQPQFHVADAAIRQGLETVSWPGRLQLIERPNGQRVLVDGAHNAAGAAALRGVVELDRAGTRPVLMLGILQDKDWEAMCETLAPLADSILCVPVRSERSASPQELVEACRRTNPSISIRCYDSLASALDASSKAPFILITGSLYLVGEAMELLQDQSVPGRDERALNAWR